MKCSKCGNGIVSVIDSRTTEEGNSIRRRRKCSECNHRFTTFEKHEEHKVEKAPKGSYYICTYCNITKEFKGRVIPHLPLDLEIPNEVIISWQKIP